MFCEAEGIDRPPPYKDFAHALKDVMPRKRSDKLLEGKAHDGDLLQGA